MLALRPLEIELGLGDLLGTAGAHDLESWSVQMESANSRLVGRHESLHDRLLYETPYGIVQVVFKKLAKLASDTALQRKAALWLGILISNSRDTHERFATYLSIKAEPIEKHVELLLAHPASYQKYYFDIASVVDGVFKSSFLQYLVGVTFVEICFASRLQERLCDWNLSFPTEFREHELPDFRFQELASFCTRSRMTELLLYVSRSYRGMPDVDLAEVPHDFDINREEDWLALNLETSTKLDEVILELTRNWFYEKSAKLWPCLFLEEWLVEVGVIIP